jgi:hypothetical protein
LSISADVEHATFRSSNRSQRSSENRDQEQQQDHKEYHLGETDGRRCYSAKTKNGRDERDDQKCDNQIEHGFIFPITSHREMKANSRNFWKRVLTLKMPGSEKVPPERFCGIAPRNRKPL